MKNLLLKDNALIEKRELFFLILNMFLFKTFSNDPEFFLSNYGNHAFLHALVGSILTAMYAALISFIFEKIGNENLLDFKGGKKVSYLFLIIKAILILYLFLSAALGLYRAAELASLSAFENTPFIFSALFFLIAIFIGQNARIKDISKTAEILLSFSAPILIIILLFSLKNADITNIFPIFKTKENFSFLSILNDVSYYMDFVVVLLLNPSLKKDKSFKKTFFSATLCGALLSFSIVFFLILTFPRDGLSHISNPIFQTVKSVSFGRFMQRVDSLFLLTFAFSAMIYLSSLASIILNVINPDLKGMKKLICSFITTAIIFLLALSASNNSLSVTPLISSLLAAFTALYIVFASLSILKKKGQKK